MLDRAVKGKMNLIPVLLHNAELPPFLASRSWVDFRGVHGEVYLQRVRELAESIRAKQNQQPQRTGVLTLPPKSVVAPVGPIERILHIDQK